MKRICDLSELIPDFKTKYQVFLAMALSVKNGLSRNEVCFTYPIEDINTLCEQDINWVRGCGEKALKDMNDKLSALNLHIKMRKENQQDMSLQKRNEILKTTLSAMKECKGCFFEDVCNILTIQNETSICIIKGI